MPQLDFFNDVEKPKETLEEQFLREREEWTSKIKTMSAKIKNVHDMPILMTELYSERQICLDYYHYLISIMATLNKKYRADYSARYDYWSFQSQIRYPNDSAKNYKILSELSDIVSKREAVENHSKFIADTKSTIDNLIYGVKYRVEIEQIIRGNK
jgi:hypothetical protein